MGVYPLDIPLHVGAHVQVRAAIGANNRPYAAAPFVRDHAVALRAAGAGPHHALTLLLHFVANIPTAAQFDACVTLADRLFRAGWTLVPIRQLTDDFRLNANGLTAADWAAIGAALPPNRQAETTQIARLAGWNAAGTLALAQAHTANNPNHWPVALWVNLAGLLGANQAVRTAYFARIAGWSHAAVTQLVQNFVAANPNNFSGANWAGLAAVVPVNDVAGATALARVAGVAAAVWTFAPALALAQARAAANPNNLTAAEWTVIAAVLPADQHADTTAFARTAGTGGAQWNAASTVTLAQAFAANNPNGFTSAQWTAIAATLPANRHADTATFARAAGWQHADVVTLATRFGNDAHGQAAATWIAMANRIYPRHGWDQLTESAMEYRTMGWPDSVQIQPVAAVAATVAWFLEASNDGVVYRVTGAQNPHITVHGLNGAGPNNWIGHGARDLHVRTAAALWDFTARHFDPFLAPGAHAPAVPANVQSIIDSFCNALGV